MSSILATTKLQVSAVSVTEIEMQIDTDSMQHCKEPNSPQKFSFTLTDICAENDPSIGEGDELADHFDGITGQSSYVT